MKDIYGNEIAEFKNHVDNRMPKCSSGFSTLVLRREALNVKPAGGRRAWSYDPKLAKPMPCYMVPVEQYDLEQAKRVVA